jgi:hypothetical protein
MTFFYKRVLPVCWFVILGLAMIGPAAIEWRAGQAIQSASFVVPAFMMAIGYFFMRKLLFNLVDQVLDAGDALLVKNGAQQEQIPLADIINISYVQMMNPPQVTLSLRRPTAFGEKVTFCAPTRLMPFATSPVIDDLIKRVDAARRRGR